MSKSKDVPQGLPEWLDADLKKLSNTKDSKTRTEILIGIARNPALTPPEAETLARAAMQVEKNAQARERKAARLDYIIGGTVLAILLTFVGRGCMWLEERKKEREQQQKQSEVEVPGSSQ